MQNSQRVVVHLGFVFLGMKPQWEAAKFPGKMTNLFCLPSMAAGPGREGWYGVRTVEGVGVSADFQDSRSCWVILNFEGCCFKPTVVQISTSGWWLNAFESKADLDTFSEFIPFGVNCPIREGSVWKQVLKIQCATGEWHLKRDPDELPFCARAQRRALFCQWTLRSSRLKCILCPQKKLKAVNASTHRGCAEIWCHCSRRGVMLSLPVLVELLRLLGIFLGHQENRPSGLRVYSSLS